MARKDEDLDHKGLIRESYRIDGITEAECRSIFLDWALSLPDDGDAEASRQILLAIYAPKHPDHPMTHVLREGLGVSETPRRRGGWRSRTRPAK